MAGILDYYGYKETATPIVTVKAQEEQKQSERDSEQDALIKKNDEINTAQQSEIDRNSLINDAQIAQIKDLYDKIEHLPTSGGTVTDLDMGDW